MNWFSNAICPVLFGQPFTKRVSLQMTRTGQFYPRDQTNKWLLQSPWTWMTCSFNNPLEYSQPVSSRLNSSTWSQSDHRLHKDLTLWNCNTIVTHTQTHTHTDTHTHTTTIIPYFMMMSLNIIGNAIAVNSHGFKMAHRLRFIFCSHRKIAKAKHFFDTSDLFAQCGRTFILS